MSKGKAYVERCVLMGLVSIPREDLARYSENPLEYFELIRHAKSLGILVAGKLSSRNKERMKIKNDNHYKWECRS